MTGTSARENFAEVREYVHRIAAGAIQRPIVLDVGAGGGTYADCLAGLPINLEAVESWLPSVEALTADPRYSYVYHYDARTMPARVWSAVDVVIFGDVLEHMDVHDAHVVWDKAWSTGAAVIVSVPNSPYPQGAIDGNHLEEHLILDPIPELIAYLPPYDHRYDYPVTSTFIWNGGAQ